ncbi:MAG: NAD(P)-dependent dehydrogenase (short-subunit alcohol dehydrogenase family) [Flavobacteriales bacterium]|jgi:NAD(P)-dependent dehydrogenase (short-subunit alcohol dehydrogenase family)
MNIQGKIALVTGANRGIGKAVVEGFIAQGAAKVYLAVRNRSTVAELLERYGDKLVALDLDLTKPASIDALARSASDVDIVVNNAGLLKQGDLFADDIEQSFREELEVNTFGLLRMAKAFEPILLAKKEAAFVQLNSVGSIANFDGLSSYCASKAACYTFTQALRTRWKESAIRVVSILPGPIATDMARQVDMYDDGASPMEVADAIVNAIKDGEFHVYPDAVAKSFGEAYSGYAQSIVEAA